MTAVATTAGAQAPDAGHAGIAARKAEAAHLRAAVEAESRRIDATSEGLAEAESRLAALDARAKLRTSQAIDAQDRLVRARVRLTALQHRAAFANRLLETNLVAAYKGGTPDIVTVVLDANGFADLLERVRFYDRVSRTNGRILDATREARTEVAGQAQALERLRARFGALAKAAVADRDQADVIRNALLRRQAEQLRRRDGTSSRLQLVRQGIDRLERRQAAAAAAVRQAATATRAAPRPTTAPDPGAGESGPSSASGAVAQVVAAANQIASTPYVWGGGHGGASGGYDCSGSISYALAAAGLLGSPLDSTGFMSWGEAGPGQHITVYANAGHAFMIVDGRRFDTSALSGGGTRWTSAGRSTAGFVARHPPGL
jgi:cell wall-associated NlpC family hydrolase